MIAFLSVFSIATAACIQIQFACKKKHRRETPFTNQEIKHRNEKPIDHDLLLTRLIFIWLFNIHPFWECFVCISVCNPHSNLLYLFFFSFFVHSPVVFFQRKTNAYLCFVDGILETIIIIEWNATIIFCLIICDRTQITVKIQYIMMNSDCIW